MRKGKLGELQRWKNWETERRDSERASEIRESKRQRVRKDKDGEIRRQMEKQERKEEWNSMTQ